MLLLPYQEQNGDSALKSMRRRLKTLLPNNFNTQIAFKGKKLKVGTSLSEKNCIICFIERLLEIMNNAFYFILKALFILKIFNFLSKLFGHVEKTA